MEALKRNIADLETNMEWRVEEKTIAKVNEITRPRPEDRRLYCGRPNGAVTVAELRRQQLGQRGAAGSK
jgi:hypothetical protein